MAARTTKSLNIQVLLPLSMSFQKPTSTQRNWKQRVIARRAPQQRLLKKSYLFQTACSIQLAGSYSKCLGPTRQSTRTLRDKAAQRR